MLNFEHICSSTHIYVVFMQQALRKNPLQQVRKYMLDFEHICPSTHIYVVYAAKPSLKDKYMSMAPKQVIKGSRDEVDVWVEAIVTTHLPDITDYPTITDEMLGFYKKQNKHDRHAPHYLFGGLCAQWANMSADFAIAHGKHPVKIKGKDGKETNLCPEFASTFWVRYSSLMRGKPALSSNACQLVLKYLLLNEEKLAKTWRNRLYFYSSGSVFADLGGDLVQWLDNNEPESAAWLRQLKNENGLFPILGDLIMKFIEKRGQPFPFALASKKDFWLISSWKRAMIFVFGLRHFFKMSAQKSWDKFLRKDYNFNTRAFRRYLEHDKEIITSCASYEEMSEVDTDENS